MFGIFWAFFSENFVRFLLWKIVGFFLLLKKCWYIFLDCFLRFFFSKLFFKIHIFDFSRNMFLFFFFFFFFYLDSKNIFVWNFEEFLFWALLMNYFRHIFSSHIFVTYFCDARQQRQQQLAFSYINVRYTRVVAKKVEAFNLACKFAHVE